MVLSLPSSQFLITQRKCLASSQKPEKKTNQIKAENCLCQLDDVMFAEFREKRENHRRGGQKASHSRWDSKDTGLIVMSAYLMLIRGLWIPTNGSAPQIGPTWVLKAQSHQRYSLLEYWHLILASSKLQLFLPGIRHTHSWPLLPGGSDVYDALTNIVFHQPPTARPKYS